MSEHERATLAGLIEETVTRSLDYLSASDVPPEHLAVIEVEVRRRAEIIVQETLSDRGREIAGGANLVEDWVAKVSKLRLFDIEATAAAQAKVLESLSVFSPRLMSVTDILRYALNDDREAWVDAGHRATAKLSASAGSSMRTEWREAAWRLAGRSAAEHARHYENASAAFMAQRSLHWRYDQHMKLAFENLRRTARRVRIREWFFGPAEK